MENQITVIANEMINRNLIPELIELRNSITLWIPKELLDEDNYNACCLIDNYLQRDDIKNKLEEMKTIT